MDDAPAGIFQPASAVRKEQITMSTQPKPASKPTVHTITGFVRINQDTYEALIEDARAVLGKVKTAFESSGYHVETVRMTTNPLPEVVAGKSQDQALTFLKKLDDLATNGNFILNVGPAMLHEGDDPSTMRVAERALSTLRNIEASAITADADGIHWDTIRSTAELVQYVSEHSPHSLGNLKFATTAMVNPYSPFFPGSYFTEEGEQYAVGLECADVVHDALAKNKGRYASALAALTSGLAQQISSANAVLVKVRQETPWNPGLNLIVSRVGDVSIVHAIEAYTGETFGSCGTLTAIRLIAEAVQAVDQSGNSVLALPVIEEKLLAQRWTENTYDIDSLLAYSAVGSMGVDAVPLPGQIHPGQLKRIFSDAAVLANRWNTPISARLLPVAGKRPGEMTDFNDPSLFNTKVHPLP
jgi:hypothetical protein